uniref:Uncharacterized protein n=1 Tax=Anopheles farauti TaxID=69004 RepID=A0A1Y9HA52_9DIPT
MKDIYRHLSRCLRTKVRAKGKIKEIALQLHAIDKGFKLGFLWDVGCLAMDEVRQLLDTLKEANLVRHTLVVVQLGPESGGDFGVCDIHRFAGQQSRSVVIDVSAALPTPTLADQSVVAIFDELTARMQTQLSIAGGQESLQKSTRTVRWQLDETVCRTTVYGLFIGYPVVYWYDTKTTQENCLSQVPLVVFQAGLRPQGQESFTPFISFSVPAKLLNQPAVKIALRWWEEFTNETNLQRVTFSKVFTNVIM